MIKGREFKLIMTLLGFLFLLLVVYFSLMRRTDRDGGVGLPPIGKVRAPKIVTVSPKPEATDVPVATSIEITFDREVSRDSITYTINPRLELDKTLSVDKKTILLSPLPLFEPGIFYTLTLTGDYSPYTSSFTTSQELTESDKITLQSKYDIEFNQAADEYERTHPLLSLMPVEEPLFRIEYKGDGLYEYTLKGPDKKAARVGMLDWWRRNGVEPEDLNLKEK